MGSRTAKLADNRPENLAPLLAWQLANETRGVVDEPPLTGAARARINNKLGTLRKHLNTAVQRAISDDIFTFRPRQY